MNFKKIADTSFNNSPLLLIRLSAFACITDKLRELVLELFRVVLLWVQGFSGPGIDLWLCTSIPPRYVFVQALFSFSIAFWMHYALLLFDTSGLNTIFQFKSISY